MTWDVVGLGENSLDHVIRLPAFPSPNGKRRIVGRRVSPGGQVATALCACTALGLRAAYVGTFGSDDNGRLVREALAARGVDLSRAVVRDAPNRHAVILVDERTGDRSVLWERDPRLAISPGELPQEMLTRARVVHVDDTDVEASLAAAILARDAGVLVTCDVDRVDRGARALIDAVSIPIVSEHVPAAVTGEADVERALRALRRPHHEMLCATLGARGALLLHGDRVHHAPAPAVAVVDTTGAGDVFRGAFIVARLRGRDPDRILAFANAAAALSCAREGAIDGVPALEDVEAMAAL